MSVTSFRRRCKSLLSTLWASASWRFTVDTSAATMGHEGKVEEEWSLRDQGTG
jgi:hypothetical protein